MAEVQWDLLAQYPNAGQAFTQAFQQGLAQNKERESRNALAAYAMDPTNQGAFSKAVVADPSTAISLMNAQTEKQRYSQQTNQQQHEQWAKYAGSLAKWADTPAKWDQAIDHLVQSNHPEISTQELLALKGHFDPALRQSFMAQGGVEDDKPDELTNYMEKGGIDPNSPQGTAMYGAAATNRVNPQQPIQTANPDGTITVNWVRPPMPGVSGSGGGSQGASGPTATNPKTGQKIQFNAQSGQWEPVQGGATASTPSPTFP